MTEKAYKTIAVRISAKAANIIEAEAEKDCRSVGAVIKLALEEFFAKRGIELPRKG